MSTDKLTAITNFLSVLAQLISMGVVSLQAAHQTVENLGMTQAEHDALDAEYARRIAAREAER